MSKNFSRRLSKGGGIIANRGASSFLIAKLAAKHQLLTIPGKRTFNIYYASCKKSALDDSRLSRGSYGLFSSHVRCRPYIGLGRVFGPSCLLEHLLTRSGTSSPQSQDS